MTWPAPVETETQLRVTGNVSLNGAGNGTLTWSTQNARTRWEVTSIVVLTNQLAAATVVPVATVAVNTADITTISQANIRGQSWSGNQDTFAGLIHVGPCDILTVAFSAPPGSSAGQVAQLSGVTATAIVTGTSYTRRA